MQVSGQVSSAGAVAFRPPSLFEGGLATPSRPAEPATIIHAAQSEPASRNNPELRAHALMAQDVYNDKANPPAGYRAASTAELKELGLDPAMLARGDFRARVYVGGSADNPSYTIAFRGSQSAGDWVTNLRQGMGMDSVHYRQALEIGERVARSPLADRVDFTGHSLGGGLASAAALAAGRPADTFNAAGLSDKTIEQAAAIRGEAGASLPRVDAWFVRGEVLSGAQDGGDRVAGFILGGIPGALLADAPPAYGIRHGLDAQAPDDKNWIERHNPVNKHGMDWVLNSLPH